MKQLDVPIVAILIEDDEFIAETWKWFAERQNQRLVHYRSAESFLEDQQKYDRALPIYLDWFLREGVPSLDFSVELHRLGFENIIVTTSVPKFDVSSFPWLKGVCGKECPW
jgi:FixJ family two-component response regulator